MNIEEKIREYLPTVVHMSLATCVNQKPWICEVHFVFDDQLNLYFRSRPSTRHCQEIAENQKVAGNIVKQHLVGEKVRGIYFEGVAELLEEVTSNHVAYTLYCARFATDTKILDELQEENGHQFYKISVSKFFLFDSQESSPSQKYELSWNR
jgi:uncharacterized protein YhbP (UPF0306 family)